MRLVIILAAGLLLGYSRASFSAPSKFSRHVVVMVWDGMRGDFVNEQNAPNLFALAKHGVLFSRHHSVYPSATEVNGTAISTGCYPETSTLVGNMEYRPQIDPAKGVHTEVIEVVRKGDEIASGHYLERSTMAEIIRAAGGKAYVAGAKPVALLPDRLPRASMDSGINVYAGATLPESLLEQLTNKFGPYTLSGVTNAHRNAWTTDVMVNSLWAEEVPEFTFLWMNEPDGSQHATGPGSAESLAAIRNSDEQLAKVLKALDAKGVRDTTDIFVVSDHGCSTVAAQSDVAKELAQAGIPATRAFTDKPKRGQVLVVSNSGSSFIYVIEHDRAIVARIIEFLQGWKNTGVIFTSEGLPGTFTIKEARLQSKEAPDIIVSLRWTDARNATGTPGTIVIDGTSFKPGQGAHVSLSPYDLHNLLVAAGPDFREGVTSSVPSGNIDVAPTVLHVLGLKQPAKMDGRVLTEVLRNGKGAPKFTTRRMAAKRRRPDGTWTQYLEVTQGNGVTYFEKGNGELVRH